MIIERRQNETKPRRGVIALRKGNIIPSGFDDGFGNFL